MNRSTDELDDLTLPQRPRRPDSRSDLRPDPRAAMRDDLRSDMAPRDREFTLSTGTVLALFFGLALVCAVFFGFGYSMGRKSAAAAAPAAETTSADTAEPGTTDAASVSKPSAGSPAIPAIPGYVGQKDADTANHGGSAQTSRATSPSSGTTVTVPLDGSTPVKPKKPAVDPDGEIVEAPKPAVTRGPAVASVAPSSAAVTSPVQTMNAGNTVPNGGATFVQIAAVSHKEDADVLLGALKRRGYNVFTKGGDNDKLIHVQVGPFANKKDAEAMRQKLLGDGYNAILK